jgi:hypothetical protein
VDLKSSFDEDLYNSWETHGDASAAQNVRQLGREYAGIVKEQYTGAAKNLFTTPNPEKIIPNIVTGGAKAQSTAESLLKNMSASGKQTFADSVEREIYSRATKGDGTIDAVKARDTLNKMGQTGETIFGDKHAGMTTFLNDAAQKQTETGESVLSPAQTKAPERIVYDIVSGGPKSQSQVESLMSKLTPASQKVLRDSALKEIYRQNTFPGGDDIDMAGAQRDYAGLGDTAKSLFGPDHDANSQFLDAAAKEQAAKSAAANKPSLASRATNKLSRMTGAGVGAYAGGPAGAVRIGISPTERIVLSPKAALANRGMLTQFLKAKATGQTAALTAAYNAIAKQNGDNQADSGDQNQPSSLSGGSLGAILSGGRL